jgi:hypothetical protein
LVSGVRTAARKAQARAKRRSKYAAEGGAFSELKIRSDKGPWGS